MIRRIIAGVVLTLPLFSFAAVTVSVNGSNHTIPTTNERGWGSAVTAWIQAISSNTLQPSGGTFTLGADVDFGASFGLKSAYYKSRALNPATTGIVRLGNTETISWRNAANSANLSLTANASNRLQYNSIEVVDLSTAQSLSSKSLQDSNTLFFDDGDITKKFAFNASAISTGTTRVFSFPDEGGQILVATATQTVSNKSISGASNTLSNIGYSALSLTGSILNADIAAGAAIDLSKLASLTASRALVSNGSGVVTPSSVTSTTLGYLDATSSVQTQLNSKLPTTVTTTGDMIYSTSGSTAGRLAIGTVDTMRLKVSSGVPAWGFSSSAAKTTTYAITNADEVLRYDTSGGGFTTTLPTAVGITGKTFTLKLTTAGNILTVATTGAQTIDGMSSLKMATAGDFAIVQSDGANWILVGDNINYTATYSTNVGQTVSASATLTLVDFEDMVSDPLGLVTTGAGWAYTAIRPGMYEVSALLSPITNAGADTNILDISTYVNGVSSNIFRRYMDPNANRINSISIPATPFRLSVGQTLKIYWRSYFTTVSPVLYNQNPYNYVSIKRVGN